MYIVKLGQTLTQFYQEIPQSFKTGVGALLTAAAIIMLVNTGALNALNTEEGQENIEFRMMSQGLANGELPFEGPYSVDYDNSAQVGDLQIQLDEQEITPDYTGCQQNIYLNSQSLDTSDFPTTHKRHWGTYLSWQDGDYEDTPTRYSFDGYNVEVNQNWGSWDPDWGMGECMGSIINVEREVNYSAVSVDTRYPDSVTEGESVTALITFENDWEPVTANYSLTYETPGGLTNTKSGSVDVAEGGSVTEEVSFPVETSGEISFDLSGRLGLDPEGFTAEGVSVRCSPSGEWSSPDSCGMVEVAELSDDELVKVERSYIPEFPEFSDRSGSVDDKESRPGDEPGLFGGVRNAVLNLVGSVF